MKRGLIVKFDLCGFIWFIATFILLILIFNRCIQREIICALLKYVNNKIAFGNICLCKLRVLQIIICKVKLW